MAQIGTLGASASAVFNLDFLPEYFLINNPEDTQTASNFSVVTSGVQLMSITSEARLTALARFDSGALLENVQTAAINSRVTAYLKLATGRINKATTINLTNSEAVAKNIFAASSNISNIARRAVEQSINPSANATFDNFEALIFSGTNILRAQVTFDNGFSDEYTPDELQALYGRYHMSEGNANLQGLITIAGDSGAGLITQVVLFNGSGGSTVVLKSDYVQL